MTERGVKPGWFIALLVAPACAGVFVASASWAVDNDPLNATTAQQSNSPSALLTAAPPTDAVQAPDPLAQQIAERSAQVAALRAQVDELSAQVALFEQVQPEPAVTATSVPRATTNPKPAKPATRAKVTKTVQPKAVKPKATQPKASKPKATQPKAAQPKAAQPKTAQPKVAPPKTVAAKPKAPAPPPAPKPKPKPKTTVAPPPTHATSGSS